MRVFDLNRQYSIFYHGPSFSVGMLVAEVKATGISEANLIKVHNWKPVASASAAAVWVIRSEMKPVLSFENICDIIFGTKLILI